MNIKTKTDSWHWDVGRNDYFVGNTFCSESSNSDRIAEPDRFLLLCLPWNDIAMDLHNRGGICILTGLILLYWLPRSISKPIKELKDGILEIANHNYEKRLDMSDNEEFREVADSFNRMAERLTEYRASTLSDILSAKSL